MFFLTRGFAGVILQLVYGAMKLWRCWLLPEVPRGDAGPRSDTSMPPWFRAFPQRSSRLLPPAISFPTDLSDRPVDEGTTTVL